MKLLEDYPEHFNLTKFKNLKKFGQRKRYCQKYLKELGVGSSRRVFKIDEDKVLKLAINPAGIAQNSAEYDSYIKYGENKYDVIPFIYNVDNIKYFWLEMELCPTPTNQFFIKFFAGNGTSDLVPYFDLEEAFRIMLWFEQRYNPKEYYDKDYKEIGNQLEDDIKNNNGSKYDKHGFFKSLFKWMKDNEVEVNGDYYRPENWGIAVRNGVEFPVIVDNGLTHDIMNKFYLGSGLETHHTISYEQGMETEKASSDTFEDVFYEMKEKVINENSFDQFMKSTLLNYFNIDIENKDETIFEYIVKTAPYKDLKPDDIMKYGTEEEFLEDIDNLKYTIKYAIENKIIKKCFHNEDSYFPVLDNVKLVNDLHFKTPNKLVIKYIKNGSNDKLTISGCSIFYNRFSPLANNIHDIIFENCNLIVQGKETHFSFGGVKFKNCKFVFDNSVEEINTKLFIGRANPDFSDPVFGEYSGSTETYYDGCRIENNKRIKFNIISSDTSNEKMIKRTIEKLKTEIDFPEKGNELILNL